MSIDTASLILRLKALADPVRLRLVALCTQGECSVSELTRVTGESQPRVSQQLKALCEAGILRRFRDGRRVFYRVPSRGDRDAGLRQLLELVPAQDPVFVEDARRLREERGNRLSARGPSSDSKLAARAIHKALVELTVTSWQRGPAVRSGWISMRTRAVLHAPN